MKASSIRAVMRGEPPFDPFGGEVIEPNYRAELAELRAQVRHLADDLAADGELLMEAGNAAERLYALVGREWPHEVKP